MANRNYFERPNQGGGREGHNYGHNRIQRDEPRDPWTVPTLIFAFVIVLYFASEYLR